MSRSVKDKGDGEHILKKYSRAAGDRIQWKKVEAMMCELDSENSEKARQVLVLVFWGAYVTCPDPPLLCVLLFTPSKAMGTQETTERQRVRDQDQDGR